MATVEFTTEELASEEWRPVVGWEGRYEVSNLGRVRSLRWRGNPGTGLLTRNSTTKGYLRVRPGNARGGTAKTRAVHVLVAEAFIGPRPFQGAEVNHKDGVKTNCRESNLEYTTQSANMEHAKVTGLLRPARGDRHGSVTHPESVPFGANHPRAKLTESDVRIIRERLANGEACSYIAKGFGVSHAAIRLIKKGKNWSHVQ